MTETDKIAKLLDDTDVRKVSFEGKADLTVRTFGDGLDTGIFSAVNIDGTYNNGWNFSLPYDGTNLYNRIKANTRKNKGFA
jgi:hypothetical protein